MADQDINKSNAQVITWTAVAGVVGILVAFALGLAGYEEIANVLAVISGLAVGLVCVVVLVLAVSGATAQVRDSVASHPVTKDLQERGRALADQVVKPGLAIKTGSLSTADELRKWAELRNDGLVTDEEYEVARAKLLGTRSSQQAQR